ncbi:hypothetical protein [Blastococcus sp. PRF04-17]|uniref:hypothetical protein n=1 Tax=Blastococcus sp. PRF04-17 TaxID=2933797 RepID=UPI001FF5C247|nr:hypothetical protein [Blastococcus sp. PRF04-17]UOY01042.1 hypothetical protein MVA48_19050 [Blastococcus sp. PRF04-17]
MSDLPGDRPRPTPRPRPAASPRPTPRPRVAGSRREREDTDAVRTDRATAPAPAAEAVGTPEPAAPARPAPTATARPRTSRPATSPDRSATATAQRGAPALVLVLTLLCLVAAAGAGWLLWQRLNPSSVDVSVLSATRSGIEAVYAYDYKDSEGSVQGKLDVLTGDLREQYEKDLTEGGIIDTYEQVSATTRYEVLDVGLQRINDAQDTATLVVFGQYVVESVNSGTQEAPQGSECQVTPSGAQACQQTVQVTVVDVDGEWKISELTLF